MSFPTSPTIGQIAKLVSTGPDYIYRGLGKWDVLAMDPNFDPSGYVTTAVYAPAKAIQDAAIAAAASVAASAGTVAAAAIPAAQKAAVNGVASLDGSGHVPDAQNKPLWASVQSKPSTFPPDTHTHDDRYYTKTQTDGLVSRAGGRAPATGQAARAGSGEGRTGRTDKNCASGGHRQAPRTPNARSAGGKLPADRSGSTAAARYSTRSTGSGIRTPPFRAASRASDRQGTHRPPPDDGGSRRANSADRRKIRRGATA